MHVDDAQGFLVVEDARPGEELAAAAHREARTEEGDRAQVLTPVAQDRTGGSRARQRLHAPERPVRDIEAVPAGCAEGAEARKAVVDGAGEAGAAVRPRVLRAEHRLAQVHVVPAPAFEPVPLGPLRARKALLGAVIDAGNPEGEQ